MTPAEIRTRRERLGLKQGQLAGILGVSIRTVNGWEAGRTRPSKAVELALDAFEERQVH